MNAVIEKNKIGQAMHAIPFQRFPSLVTLATGCNIGLSAHIWAWQFMHTLVLGIPAKADVSTLP